MNKYFMNLALMEAKKAYQKDEVPVGCVIVSNNKVVSKGYNNREKKNNVLGHAEINAIIKAQKKLRTWKLSNCTLYVTLRPCSMCLEIIKQARIDKVYYLLEKLEFKKEYDKTKIEQLNFSNDYATLLNTYFVNKRGKK